MDWEEKNITKKKGADQFFQNLYGSHSNDKLLVASDALSWITFSTTSTTYQLAFTVVASFMLAHTTWKLKSHQMRIIPTLTTHPSFHMFGLLTFPFRSPSRVSTAIFWLM
jgi:hypothetical protein